MSNIYSHERKAIHYEGVECRPVALTSSSGQRGMTGQYPCVGKYWTRKGEDPDVAFMLCHYSGDFSDHYLTGPLALRGFGVLGFATRYRAMPERFILEKALDDIGAGTQWLKQNTAAKRLIFIGNSGGGSLMAAFQARAERDPSTIGADAYVFLNAHPGRADVLTDVLDPSVIDENDPTKTDASLDMFNPINGPPYSEEFRLRYRAAQRERNHRITAWAKEELKRLNEAGIKDKMFGVARSYADLRYMDPDIDPSKRPVEVCYHGHPRQANRDIGLIATASTLNTWLSMYSLSESQARLDLMLALFTVPTLVIQSWQDMGVFPSYAKNIYALCGSKNKEMKWIDGWHFFEDSDENLQNCADTISEWAKETLASLQMGK